MKVEAYLKRETGGIPSKGMVGQESEWLGLCTLDLAFGKAVIADAAYAMEADIDSTHEISRGSYKASLKMIEYGRDRRVSRLRVCSKRTATLGSKLGIVEVDTATVAIWDAPFSENFQAIKELFSKKVDAAAKKRWLPGKRAFHSIVRFLGASDGKMLVVETGFGDGSYPIHELRCGNERVGFELVFIRTDEPYPFEVEEPEQVDDQLKADEALHWSLIERCWDGACAALNQGTEETRKYFGQLTSGRRALLAIDRFNKEVLRMGGIHPFFFGRSKDVLADEVLAGYRLLGAVDYADRFQQVHLLCRPIAQITNLNAQVNGLNDLFRGPAGESLYGFEDWFKEAMKDPDRRIERFIRIYAESHPDEFKD